MLKTIRKLPLPLFAAGLFFASIAPSYALDQWASTVIDVSSEYNTTDWADWSSQQALKAPNVNTYGDNVNAWAPGASDAGAEYITLGFPKAVFATGVTVRETDGYGFVTAVEAIDTKNVVHQVWAGTDTSLAGQINSFKITWPRTSYLVKALTIHINTNPRPSSGWEEIDAVQLHGIEQLSGSIAPRLGHTAVLKCVNTTTGQTVNKALTGSGQTGPVTAWNCEQAGLKFHVGDTVSIQITSTIAK